MANALWLLKNDSERTLIEYTGTTPAGVAKININGVAHAVPWANRIDSGYLALIPCGPIDCRLHMEADGETVSLLVEGETIERLAQPEPATDTPLLTPESAKWLKRLKSGRSSFLSLILLSLANIVLLMVNASIMFPFSIFSAAFAVDMGRFLADELGEGLLAGAGVAAGLVIIGVYALLYFLSKRRTWPVWTAFGLVVIDTLLLVVFAFLSEDIASFAIDFVFHCFVVWSLLSLGITHHKLSALASEPAPVPAAQIS